jgi:MYXO-CTERM domain-containing protein
MRLRTSLVVSMAIASAPFPNAANATCNAPDPKLVWSSPADGATDVPTNAAIWLLLANWHRPPEIALNGVPVPVAEIPFLYRPAVLEPRTHYEVKLTATPDSAQTLVELTWGFTTGEGPSSLEAPAPPEIDRVSATQSRELDAICTAVWSDCYDTLQDTHLLFHDAGPVPLTWVIERVAQRPEQGETSTFRLWPSICGTPEIYVRAGGVASCAGSYRIYAADVTGATAGRDVPCPLAKPATKGGGCSVADPGRQGSACLWFVIPVLVGLFTRRRRASRALSLMSTDFRGSPAPVSWGQTGCDARATPWLALISAENPYAAEHARAWTARVGSRMTTRVQRFLAERTAT